MRVEKQLLRLPPEQECSPSERLNTIELLILSRFLGLDLLQAVRVGSHFGTPEHKGEEQS
jgi:hypothetical protein